MTTTLTTVTVVVPWPHQSPLTKTGAPSKAKRAGKPHPWLSMNVANSLHHRVYEDVRRAWRAEAKRAAEGVEWRCEGDMQIRVVLYKRIANAMDPLAVVEGIKPIVDGLQEAGLIANDRQVIGASAAAVKAEDRWQCRVEITLVPVSA